MTDPADPAEPGTNPRPGTDPTPCAGRNGRGRSLRTGGEPFEITFDGHPVRALPGQTLGAVLTAAGIRAWRTTRETGRPRGLFCGIGVCFDCLVTVNDEPSRRACLTEARPGDVVTTQVGADRGL
jgi:hypothetical protein